MVALVGYRIPTKFGLVRYQHALSPRWAAGRHLRALD